MSKVDFRLHPTPRMNRAKKIKDNKKIQVVPNNFALCIDIPPKFKGKGFEELIDFMLNHPLSTAFTSVPSFFYPWIVSEFWYTCRFVEDTNTFRGTVNNGKIVVEFGLEHFRKILNLPVENNFESMVSKEEARSVLPQIKHPAKGVIKMINLQKRWAFIFSNIVRCFGNKSGSFDQVNGMEMQIFHSLFTGRKLDYARMFFDELKSDVLKDPRDFNVPYLRFLSLFIQDVVGSQVYDRFKSEIEPSPIPTNTPKIFQSPPDEKDVPLSDAMLRYVNNNEAGQSGTNNEESDDTGNNEAETNEPEQGVANNEPEEGVANNEAEQRVANNEAEEGGTNNEEGLENIIQDDATGDDNHAESQSVSNAVFGDFVEKIDKKIETHLMDFEKKMSILVKQAVEAASASKYLNLKNDFERLKKDVNEDRKSLKTCMDSITKDQNEIKKHLEELMIFVRRNDTPNVEVIVNEKKRSFFQEVGSASGTASKRQKTHDIEDDVDPNKVTEQGLLFLDT